MILYKYFPPERISFLDNRLIRFTQPSHFNDPFEFLPVEEYRETGLRAWAEEKHAQGMFQEVSINELLEEIDNLAGAFQQTDLGAFDFVGIL